MLEFLRAFFSTSAFLPQGQCYLWEPGLVWMQVASSAVIAGAFFAVSATVIYLVMRASHLPGRGVAVAAALFFLMCGFAHLADVLVIWEPAYWLHGAARSLAAVSGLAVSLTLPLVVPRAISLSERARRMHRRRMELEALQREAGPAAATPGTQAPPAEVEREHRPVLIATPRDFPMSPPLVSQPTEAPLVLVVEDSPDMNRLVCRVLEPDFRTVSARDGMEGLELAEQHRPDLILSDVVMPKMTGDNMVRELRTRPKFDGTPILMLTALADDRTSVELLRDGAQDCVSKPFSPEELRNRVGNLVTMKRVRDVLRSELETQTAGLEALATEMTMKQRELRTAVESLQVAREKAERASQMKTNFLSVVSHELRSPLATLKLQMERLRLEEQSLPEVARTLLMRMGKSADRLQALIDGLLQYARIQSGKITVRTEDVALRELVTETVSELQFHAESRGLCLSLEAPAEVVVETDPNLLRLILVNLVENAIKYTDEGSVRVVLQDDGDAARIHVIDTGLGISPDQRMRIFEPFEQVGPARKKHEPGVGLGLALVKEMVNGIRASIMVTSAVGKGSTFTIVLPAKVDEDQ